MIPDLDSFKGKKIRVFTNTMRNFQGGIVGSAIPQPFNQVVQAVTNHRLDYPRASPSVRHPMG